MALPSRRGASVRVWEESSDRGSEKFLAPCEKWERLSRYIMILELLFTSKVMVINDGLNFVLFGVFNKVRGWSRVVGPVFGCLVIRGQE